MVDLQLLTIFHFLRRELSVCKGSVLDVGAGQSPWRDLLEHVRYVGIDVESAETFGMQRNAGIIYYDGVDIPFPDGEFDHVLCVEVLEHVQNPEALLAEILRVLRQGGTLVMTVPWSARLHHLPHDYGRFSRFGLIRLLGSAGFSPVTIVERGNDIAVIANKLLVLTIRLLRPRRRLNLLWSWPLAALVGTVATAFLIAAQVAVRWRLGAEEDPLGYGVVAVKPAVGDAPAQSLRGD